MALTELTEEFKQFLTKKGVPDDAFELLKAAKVFDLQGLGNKFDERKEVTTWVESAGLGDHTDATLIGLKQAWREADAANERCAKRQAAGADDDIEAPWPDNVSEAHTNSGCGRISSLQIL